MESGTFRPRRVFRRPQPQQSLGESSIVTAGLAVAAVVFAGTATGSTPGTDGGTAEGAIVFAGGPITAANLEVSAPGTISFGGSATGRSFISRTTQAAPIVFAGTATMQPYALGTITFAGTATPASGFFTSEVAAEIAFAGTVDGAISTDASAAIVFGGTLGAPEVIGGAVESSTLPADIAFAGSANGVMVNQASASIVFSAAFAPYGYGGSAVQPLYVTLRGKRWKLTITKHQN